MTRHVRGTHILNVMDYVKSKKGTMGLERLWNVLEKDKGFKKREYDEVDFVEYDLLLEMFAVVEDIFGTADGEPRTREIGRHIVNNLGYYEYLIKESEFDELIRSAEKGWSLVYDFGRIELFSHDDGCSVVRYHGFPDDRNICDYFQGSLEADVQMLGLAGEVQLTACPADGDDFMEFTIIWE